MKSKKNGFDSLKPINQSVLRNDVFKQVKKAILQGIFPAGERLSEASLAKKLGVSRTPVREALHRLEMEGLVDTVPRRGTFVKELAFDQLEEIYRVRGLIEGYCGRLAARLAKENDLAELNALWEEYRDAIAQGNEGDYPDITNRFHHKIVSFCGPIVQRIMEDLWSYTSSVRAVAMSQHERPQEVLEEHRALLDAIKNSDEDESDRITSTM